MQAPGQHRPKPETTMQRRPEEETPQWPPPDPGCRDQLCCLTLRPISGPLLVRTQTSLPLRNDPCHCHHQNPSASASAEAVQAVVIKTVDWRLVHNRHLFLSVLDAGKFKIKVLAN